VWRLSKESGILDKEVLAREALARGRSFQKLRKVLTEIVLVKRVLVKGKFFKN